MGCSHTEECPLFPLLNASLRGWREYYCDSEHGWHGCARYKLSLIGPVPINLLPNGVTAHLLHESSDTERSTANHRPAVAEPRRIPPPLRQPPPHQPPPRQPPAPRYRPEYPVAGYPESDYQPAAYQPAGYSQSGYRETGYPEATARYEPSRRATGSYEPSRHAQVPPHPGYPSPRSARRTRQRWWTRLADWITSPA